MNGQSNISTTTEATAPGPERRPGLGRTQEIAMRTTTAKGASKEISGLPWLRRKSQQGVAVASALLYSSAVLWATVAAGQNTRSVKPVWEPSPSPDVTGYIINWGTNSGEYTLNLKIPNRTNIVEGEALILGPTIVLTNGPTWYFAVQPTNTLGDVGDYGNEVVTTLKPPEPIQRLRFQIFSSTNLSGLFSPSNSYMMAEIPFPSVTNDTLFLGSNLEIIER